VSRQAAQLFASPRQLATRPAAGRAGFSLIEILVVITLIGLLMTFGFTAMQGAMERGRVTKCKDNLNQVGQALALYRERNKSRWPTESGIRFLLTLHRHKEITGRGADIFLCPGTSDINDNGVSGEIGSAYDDWASISSDSISYAGRDAGAYPIRGSNEGNEVLAADDNEFGPNHKTITNILYADGSVVSFDLPIEGEQILLEFPEYAETGLPVGPASPLPALQVLRVD
jgi:prepilin-type N-terminal cleavage/methylation domain-containing protein/prepilin-type processing-associated H-X9-DG protein